MYVLEGFRKNKNYNLKSTEYYVADFETSSTDETDDEVFVYATGLMKVNDKRNILYYNNNIENFVKDLYKMETSTTIIYFHNLSFDIEFLLNYLVNKQGFKQVVNSYEENEDGLNDIFTPYSTAYTKSSNSNDNGGSSEDTTNQKQETTNEEKQSYDEEYNKTRK